MYFFEFKVFIREDYNFFFLWKFTSLAFCWPQDSCEWEPSGCTGGSWGTEENSAGYPRHQVRLVRPLPEKNIHTDIKDLNTGQSKELDAFCLDLRPFCIMSENRTLQTTYVSEKLQTLRIWLLEGVKIWCLDWIQSVWNPS